MTAVSIVLTDEQVASVIAQAGPTGPTGPTAPTGPTGPTAPTAPTGPTGPTVAPPVNPPPNNGVSWHAVARFVPANTHAKFNFNYLMSLGAQYPSSSFGLCYAAVSSSSIGTNLKSIPNIGTQAEQNAIINTFQ